MNTGRWSTLLRLTSLLVVLVFVFGLVSPVHAEGEEPVVPAEGTPPAEGAPVGEAPAEETPPSADLGETIEVLDENNAVLLDESGQPVPMAGEEALDLLTAPDPYFTCPVAKDTSDGTADGVCHYFTIQDAVNDFAAKSGSGMITIEAGTFNENVEVSGVSGLTGLRGNGSTEKQADPDDRTVVTGYILIENMASGFTIGGMDISDSSPADNLRFVNVGGTITVEDVTVTENGSGTPGGDGIVVTDSTAAVNIKNVKVWNMPGDGIQIDNSKGTANVNVSNSSAVFNGGIGLNINTRGTTNLSAFVARLNGGSGAEMVTLKGANIQSSIFDDNDGYGLAIFPASAGTVTIKNVSANENWYGGVIVNIQGTGTVLLENITANANGQKPGASTYDYFESGVLVRVRTSGSATLKNITAHGNDAVTTSYPLETWDGIDVWVNGAITATGLKANDNGGFGINISQFADVSAPILLKDANVYNNRGHGIFIGNSKGAITLDSLGSTYNGAGGLVVNNTAGIGAVTLLASLHENFISNNTGLLYDPVGDTTEIYPGVLIDTRGAVTVNKLAADYNSYGGAKIISTTGAVTLKGVNPWDNRFYLNGGTGLDISTLGAISLTGVTAWGNSASGVVVNRVVDSKAPVTVSKAEIYYNDGQYGLYVRTGGLITIKGIRVGNNSNYGAWLDNATPLLKGITIADKAWSTFSRNPGGGLIIRTNGPVTLQNVAASENTLFDVSLSGSSGYYGNGIPAYSSQTYGFSALEDQEVEVTLETTFSGSITLADSLWNSYSTEYFSSGESTFTWTIPINENFLVQISSEWEGGSYTIEISVDGAPTPDDPETLGGYGVDIDNRGGTAPVKITNPLPGNYYYPSGEFDANGLGGVYIQSKGPVNLTGVRAHNNYGMGLEVTTTSTSTFQGKSLGAVGNFADGIHIQTGGGVNLVPANVENNYGAGISIQAPGAVTITGSKDYASVYGNTFAILVQSSGNITISNIAAFNNTLGMLLLNPTSTGTVTLKNISGGSEVVGLHVITKGTVSLTNFFWNNADFGALIDNQSTLLRPVTLTNCSFNQTGMIALDLDSSGAITLKSVNAWYGDGAGFDLDNTSGTAAVSVSGGELDGRASEEGAGLKIRTNGAITVTGLYIEGFDGHGMDLSNANSTLLVKPGVTVKTSNVQEVSGSGVFVETKGAILIDSVVVDEANAGLFLVNLGGMANVTIQGKTYLSDFTEDGITVFSNGSLLINGAHVDDARWGLWLFNHPGAVVINNSSFTNNSASGVYIRMNGQGKVLTITRSSFLDNLAHGIDAETAGPILLNAVKADLNGESGAYLRNSNATVPAPVVISNSYGANSFNENDDGLEVYSKGSISLTGFTADYNVRYGLYLDSCNWNISCQSNGSISVKTGSASHNGHSGLYLDSGSTILVQGVTAIYNGDFEESFEYGDGITAWSVGNTSISASSFYGNYLYGIRVTKETGSLLLSGVNYYGNHMDGNYHLPNILSE